MKLRCRIGWHDWTPWGDITKANFTVLPESTYDAVMRKSFGLAAHEIVTRSWQDRRCNECGAAQRRTITP